MDLGELGDMVTVTVVGPEWADTKLDPLDVADDNDSRGVRSDETEIEYLFDEVEGLSVVDSVEDRVDFSVENLSVVDSTCDREVLGRVKVLSVAES